MANSNPEEVVNDNSSSPTAPKRKASNAAKPGVVQFTSRNPPWSYLKLQLIPQPGSSTSQPIDALSARAYLSSALSQFLGLTGTAIPIDILKIEPGSPSVKTPDALAAQPDTRSYDTVWVRVPREDAAAVVAALSSWIGSGGGSSAANVAWRICAKGNYLGALVAGSGSDLFVA